jgi:antitoxin VapB
VETAKLFLNGRSQAVRLPKAYRFEGMSEVYIQRDGDRIVLSPTRKPPMQRLIDALAGFDNFPARNQPRKTDRRESF